MSQHQSRVNSIRDALSGEVQRGLRALWVRVSLSCGALRCVPALEKERAVVARVAFRFPSHHRWSSCLCLKLPGNS